MNAFKNSFLKFSANFLHFAKYSSTTFNNLHIPLRFESNFTSEEQLKILDILNTSTPEDLIRFKLSQARIKNLQSWKTKKGPFRSLSEVLEVDGLGEKVLEKICLNIRNDISSLKNDTIKDPPVKNISPTAVSKRFKPILMPSLDGYVANKLRLAVGVHLSMTGVSWATLNKSDKSIVEWGYEDYGSKLPKKMFPNDTFDLAIKIVKKIPLGDVYVFENNSSRGPSTNTQAAAITSFTQHLELLAMLVALINTSVEHNDSLQKVETLEDMENRVFHLKAMVPARMFKTLIGSEKVAAESAISQLLGNPEELTLPCTPVKVSEELKTSFYSQQPQNKELLAHALMLIVSFMDLCVYKNPNSLDSLVRGKRKN